MSDGMEMETIHLGHQARRGARSGPHIVSQLYGPSPTPLQSPQGPPNFPSAGNAAGIASHQQGE